MRSRAVRASALIVLVLAAGTLGYRWIEGAAWWDAFYMTVITLTTVGFGEVFPLSRTGQAFTVVLLTAGLGILFVGATEAARWVFEGELRGLFEKARRSRMIDRLSDHDVVCGWGRMGRAVVDELRRSGRSLVVVESDPDKARHLQEREIPIVEGDATSESILRSAGVGRARGLVVCLRDDAHNVYTVLTARSLNARLFIVARASEDGAEDRLRRAGADRVVNPYRLGGIRLAHDIVKPAVVDFLDLSLGPSGQELRIEQLRLPASGPLARRSVAEAELRSRFGLGLVAVQRAKQTFPSPGPEFRLEPSDVLVVLGTREQLSRFESEACGENS